MYILRHSVKRQKPDQGLICTLDVL